MITMKGQFNSANIMIDEIDDTTRDQIQGFLNHPAFANSYLAVMPDCHAGKGAVVGFTMKQNDYVIPNVIGVDIGCGMLMAKYNMSSVDLPALDNFIKQNIPSGFHINPTVGYVPHKLEVYIQDVCTTIGIDTTKALRALGSLGGGNHFIEAGYDREHHLVITIHSGSRNFGKCVADFYQQKAKSGLEQYFIRDQYADLEFLPRDSRYGQMYIHSMVVAQEFASINRILMMERLSIFLKETPLETIESVHNFIGDDGIVRKGATSARLGEKVIIPFNMADGIAVCVGKGNPKYNFSAPHGAGRIMSRTQAKKQLSLDGFLGQMANAGVFTTTACEETLDEAPGAYKAMDLILDNIKETVDVVDMIKPVYNFKAGGE